MLLIRAISPRDKHILEEFLYNAIFVPHGTSPFPRDEIYKPEVYIYIDRFGEKLDDIGVVAELDGKPIGAAWVRVIPAYGHIDEKTPELATSVLREYRSQGVGTKVMTQLFKILTENGYKQTSLAVQKENPAVRFYKRLGYDIVHEAEEEYIMLKLLSENEVFGL
jgi:ribosomal protein S18 acetylase RimI-like enzyme